MTVCFDLNHTNFPFSLVHISVKNLLLVLLLQSTTRYFPDSGAIQEYSCRILLGNQNNQSIMDVCIYVCVYGQIKFLRWFEVASSLHLRHPHSYQAERSGKKSSSNPLIHELFEIVRDSKQAERRLVFWQRLAESWERLNVIAFRVVQPPLHPETKRATRCSGARRTTWLLPLAQSSPPLRSSSLCSVLPAFAPKFEEPSKREATPQ
jgi:hypothetical protein